MFQPTSHDKLQEDTLSSVFKNTFCRLNINYNSWTTEIQTLNVKSDIYSSYLFSDKGDKPKEMKGERIEQQMLDTARTAESSTNRSDEAR